MLTEHKRKCRDKFAKVLLAECRRARQEAGITQAAMAKTLGLTRCAVVNMECPHKNAIHRSIHVHQLVVWSRKCGLKPGTLLYRAMKANGDQ